MKLDYRLLNVFPDRERPFSGNQFCVFTDARGVDDETMQSLAGQMNVETSFIVPSKDGDPDPTVRFFSPHAEMGFAGTASIATAFVLSDMLGIDGELTLHEKSEDILVTRNKKTFVLKAKPGTSKELRTDVSFLAGLIGVKPDQFAGQARVAQGVRKSVVVPMNTVEDLRSAHVDSRLLHSYAMLMNTEPTIYMWAPNKDEDDLIHARMFIGPRGGVREVPATVSGCANLGHTLRDTGTRGTSFRVHQGTTLGRPSWMRLRITDNGTVLVGGEVDQVGEGSVEF